LRARAWPAAQLPPRPLHPPTRGAGHAALAALPAPRPPPPRCSPPTPRRWRACLRLGNELARPQGLDEGVAPGGRRLRALLREHARRVAAQHRLALVVLLLPGACGGQGGAAGRGGGAGGGQAQRPEALAARRSQERSASARMPTPLCRWQRSAEPASAHSLWYPHHLHFPWLPHCSSGRSGGVALGSGSPRRRACLRACLRFRQRRPTEPRGKRVERCPGGSIGGACGMSLLMQVDDLKRSWHAIYTVRSRTGREISPRVRTVQRQAWR
jgi:hypothetical protein